MRDLKFVVDRKIHAEVPRHDIVVMQIPIDDDASHAVDTGRNAPRRIAKMATRLGPTWTELAHDTSQTLGPIAWTKGAPALG